MSKTEKRPEAGTKPAEPIPVGWRRTAKIFWWLVLITATTISVTGNLVHADAVAPEQFRLLARVIGGGSPIALLLMIEGAELGLLARAHGAARTVGLALLVPLAGIVFATSYAGLLYVVTESNLADTDALRWSLAAVPDLLMVTATIYLVALRSTGERAAKVPREGRWTRLSSLADAATARATASLAVRESPQVEGASPTPDAVHGAPVTQPVVHHDAVRDAAVERATVHHDAVREPHRDPAAARTTVHHEPDRDAPVNRAVTHPEPARDAARGPLHLRGDAAAVAQRIVDQTTITQPVDVIEKVLTLAAGGASQREIGKNSGASASTARRIIQAARELDTEEAEAEQRVLMPVG
jgi:hypothetical protein